MPPPPSPPPPLDIPPPPYSETDIYSSTPSFHTAPLRRHTTQEADDAASPPPSASSSSGEVIYTPPQTPHSGSHHLDQEDGVLNSVTSSSARAYFESRPVQFYHAGEQLVHTVAVHPDSSLDDFPYPPQWAGRDIRPADWYTFVNHLLPRHPSLSASRGGRKPRAEGSNSSRSSNDNDGLTDVKDHRDGAPTDPELRRQSLEDSVREWNDGFFSPRGVTIRLDSWGHSFDHRDGAATSGPGFRPGEEYGNNSSTDPGTLRFGGLSIGGDGVSIGRNIVADRNGLRVGNIVADSNGLRIGGVPFFGNLSNNNNISNRDNDPVVSRHCHGGRQGGWGCRGGGGGGRGFPGPGVPHLGGGPWSTWGASHPHHQHGPGRGLHGGMECGRGRGRGRGGGWGGGWGRGRQHEGDPFSHHPGGSASRSSSVDSASSSDSDSSLPAPRDLRPGQLVAAKEALQGMLNTSDQSVTKGNVKQAREMIKAAGKNSDPSLSEVERKVLVQEVKSLMKMWKVLRWNQKRARRHQKRMQRFEKKAAKQAAKRERYIGRMGSTATYGAPGEGGPPGPSMNAFGSGFGSGHPWWTMRGTAPFAPPPPPPPPPPPHAAPAAPVPPVPPVPPMSFFAHSGFGPRGFASAGGMFGHMAANCVPSNPEATQRNAGLSTGAQASGTRHRGSDKKGESTGYGPAREEIRREMEDVERKMGARRAELAKLRQKAKGDKEAGKGAAEKDRSRSPNECRISELESEIDGLQRSLESLLQVDADCLLAWELAQEDLKNS